MDWGPGVHVLGPGAAAEEVGDDLLMGVCSALCCEEEGALVFVVDVYGIVPLPERSQEQEDEGIVAALARSLEGALADPLWEAFCAFSARRVQGGADKGDVAVLGGG